MKDKIKNYIKRCLMTMTVTKGRPKVQVTAHGGVFTCEFFTPYGLYSRPKASNKALGIMFSVAGEGDDFAVMINCPWTRIKKLEEGEVATGNPETGSHVKFKANGDIEVYSNGGKIKLGNGTDLEKALVLFEELKTYIDAHTHSSSGSGPPNTLLPTSAKTKIVEGV